MFCIAIYIRKKSSAKAIFKQIRVGENRRNHERPVRYFLDPESGQLRSDRRKCIDAFWPATSERRKSNSNLFYLCPKNGRIKRERRKTNLLGRPFTFYKFRTMYPDAQTRFPELYTYRYTKKQILHMKFKIEDDPRVPRWAEWLRQSSIDELPNFVNVLRGDMSIVGPRPDISQMTKYYTYDQHVKLNVKPGITGLAQIKGRGRLRFQETLKYDVEYVKKRSFWLDMKIIAETIRAILRGDGAF